ncbi:ATP-binding cassette (ABC) Superfamily [Phytophthora palmivora]|uniref:ATP-binding cassette (ABC) Superfamily n=1 Tax=Phytophthora palmivora TaxID=4796 RepID=A0A2P4XU18_9STRA|nr:ATP-binding cassette (ABC) Superfamily [Phytophthora palmivora]
MSKSKDKAALRKEAHKATSKTASKPTADAATQGGSQRRSRSRFFSPDDRRNPRFTYRVHSPGAESPDFVIPKIMGSESEEDTTGSTKDPTPAQDAPNLTLAEGKARAQAAKAASSKRADEGAAAAKKRAAPGSPTSEPTIAKGFRSLSDSSDEEEEEGAVSEPQKISNDFDEQQERYQAAQLQGASAQPTPVYPRGYYRPDAGSGSLMFLERLRAPRGINPWLT